jgi:hypothetical protein
MNIKEILKDSVRYPLSDWKKILLLGIIFVIGNLSNTAESNSLVIINITVTFFLGIISFLILLLAVGYQFRIIKSSLIGLAEPPEFNKWIDMFKDGVKLFLVKTVYTIPAILIIILAALFFASDPSTVVNTSLVLGTWFLIGGPGINFAAWVGIWFIIALLYVIIITPIMWMAIAHMADNESEIRAAFRFHTILNEITNKGWKNLIIWYIMTEILYLILGIIILFLIVLFSVNIPIIGIGTRKILEAVLTGLIVIPYTLMYLYRSIALFYISE